MHPKKETDDPVTQRSGDRIFEIGWLAAALLVPLVVDPWGFNPFAPIKIAVLRSIAWGLAIIWALRTVSGGPERSGGTAGPLVASALFLVVIEALATAFAVNPGYSLWGSLERGQGLLTLVCYPIFGLIVASRMVRTRQALRLSTLVQLGAVPLLVIGMAQFAGWQSGLVTDARSPVFSTLGRSNFVAAYLAMLIPLTLVRTAYSEGTKRIGWAVLLGLEAVVTALTRVRSGWAGAMVGIAVVLLLVSRRRLGVLWRRPGIRMGLLAAGGLASAGFISIARAGGSGAARLSLWRACLQLLFDRPFLGYGPDALPLVFSRVFPPELVYYEGRHALIDRAHTFPLDWALTLGILGLVAWLAVLWTVAGTTRRALGRVDRDGEREILLIAAAGAVAANLVTTLLGFDLTSTSLLLWLLLGTMTALGVGPAAGPGSDAPSSSPGRPVIRGVGLLLGVSVVLFAFRPVAADHLMGRAVTTAASDPGGALRRARRAVRRWPREARYFLSLAALAEKAAESEPDEASEDLKVAETALHRAVALQPQRFDLWLELGRFYGRRAAAVPETGAEERADAALRRALELAPQHAEVYRARGMFLLREGRLAPALESFAKAVDLDASNWLSRTRLAEVQLALGRVGDARANFERAEGEAPGFGPALFGLAETSLRMGDADRAAAAVRRLREIEPENPAVAALARRISAALNPSAVTPREDSH